MTDHHGKNIKVKSECVQSKDGTNMCACFGRLCNGSGKVNSVGVLAMAAGFFVLGQVVFGGGK